MSNVLLKDTQQEQCWLRTAKELHNPISSLHLACKLNRHRSLCMNDLGVSMQVTSRHRCSEYHKNLEAAIED